MVRGRYQTCQVLVHYSHTTLWIILLVKCSIDILRAQHLLNDLFEAVFKLLCVISLPSDETSRYSVHDGAELPLLENILGKLEIRCLALLDGHFETPEHDGQ